MCVRTNKYIYQIAGICYSNSECISHLNNKNCFNEQTKNKNSNFFIIPTLSKTSKKKKKRKKMRRTNGINI